MSETIELQWNDVDQELPDGKGTYLVCWASPYSGRMTLACAWWSGDRFDGSPAGANYIVAWADIEMPDISLEKRQERCG